MCKSSNMGRIRDLANQSSFTIPTTTTITKCLTSPLRTTFWGFFNFCELCDSNLLEQISFTINPFKIVRRGEAKHFKNHVNKFKKQQKFFSQYLKQKHPIFQKNIQNEEKTCSQFSHNFSSAKNEIKGTILNRTLGSCYHQPNYYKSSNRDFSHKL